MFGMRLGAGRAGAGEVLLIELVGAVRPAAGERREALNVYEPLKKPGKKLRMSSN